MAIKRKHKEDPRLQIVSADGGGSRAEYKIKGRDDVCVSFEMYDDDGTESDYPWFPSPIKNGRLMSHVGYAYATSKACIDAVLDGSWLKQE